MNTIKITLLSFALSLLLSCENIAESDVDPINTNSNSTSTNSGNSSNNDNETNSGTTTANTKNFTLTSDVNMRVSLSDYKDNVVVLFFFGNGCSSCKAVSPEIQKTFVDNYANKKVQVIGLDTWDGNLNSVKSFKSSSNLTFPLLLEASGVAKTFETTYDRILVIDKKGEVKFSKKERLNTRLPKSLSEIITPIQI